MVLTKSKVVVGANRRTVVSDGGVSPINEVQARNDASAGLNGRLRRSFSSREQRGSPAKLPESPSIRYDVPDIRTLETQAREELIYAAKTRLTQPMIFNEPPYGLKSNPKTPEHTQQCRFHHRTDMRNSKVHADLESNHDQAQRKM